MVEPGHSLVVRDGELATELSLFRLLAGHLLHLSRLGPLGEKQGHRTGQCFATLVCRGSQGVLGGVGDGRLGSLHLALVRLLSGTVGMELSWLGSQVELLEIVEVVE